MAKTSARMISTLPTLFRPASPAPLTRPLRNIMPASLMVTSDIEQAILSLPSSRRESEHLLIYDEDDDDAFTTTRR